MKKRILSLLLCACLLLSSALAAEMGNNFPTVNTYAPGHFADVAEGTWYTDAVKLCYETGLMNGTGSGFAPQKVLTIAECTAIAARIREALTGEAIVRSTPLPGEAKEWYTDYVNYMARDTGLTSILNRPTQAITRMEYLQLLNAALPAEGDLLAPINAIQTLPDTDDPDVLSFYNAGVLTGVDAYGTFNGGGTLSRAECAAMVARIVDPSLRKTFTPAEKPAEPSGKPTLSYEEELMQTEAVRINGTTVTFGQFIETLNSSVAEVDAALKSNSGKGLDWNAKYSGVDDLPGYFKNLALTRLVESTVVSTQARALGCTVETLPAFLTPDPSKALDNIYCAKHILVDDEATAKNIIARLQAQSTMETFNALLAQYGTDPGMTSNPNGYLFTDGEMVSEFENAVKALPVNGFNNAPVKSQFGYHVILRLDPTTYPGWQQAVQEMKYEEYLNAWMASATVTPNTAELERLDVQARYEAYLAAQKG